MIIFQKLRAQKKSFLNNDAILMGFDVKNGLILFLRLCFDTGNAFSMSDEDKVIMWIDWKLLKNHKFTTFELLAYIIAKPNKEIMYKNFNWKIWFWEVSKIFSTHNSNQKVSPHIHKRK